MENPVTREDEDEVRFTYFVVRVRLGRGMQADGPSGTIERLGSGYKQDFSGARELLRLIVEGPAAPGL